jgi:hypothetical protein
MKRIISMLLILTTLFATFAVNVSAARAEEYVSEVALIYEDSVEEAKQAIAGTDWKLFEQDLNANADYMIDDGVYLIYKTSTNVEDAITDLRVMDMYGGFSISNYERELENSRKEYLAMCNDIRTAAAEFKALYEEGDRMAALAYRQMNYYKDVKTANGTETDMLMGDFFLNLPADEKIVQVMMEGNSMVVSNLLSLLAIGLSNESHSLNQRVAEFYAIRDTLTDEVYHDEAVKLNSSIEELAAKIKRYDTLKDKYQLYDEEMSEEEIVFVNEVGAVSLLVESIQLGDGTLADLLRNENRSLTDFYPLIAAFTKGQMALIKMGAFELVLKHATPSTSIDKMIELVDKLEKDMLDENGNMNPIDVYIGVDRSIFKGSFAMTTAAERQQALTGETWDLGSAAMDSLGFYVAGAALVVLDIVAWGCFAAKLSKVPIGMEFYAVSRTIGSKIIVDGHGVITSKAITPVTTWNWAGIWFWTAIGIAVVAAGLVGISTWYNYYNPDYTEIPNTMVDVRETDLGDKYIKYTAAKVFEDGKLSEKNADFNAYEGKEWNALYYTKDAQAGNCLTPYFVFKDNDNTIARRHQGVSMFGEDKAFNLNSHVFNGSAKGAYLTVRYSTAKKAAADVPTVVGSMIAQGAFYALTALAGAGAGVGGTILFQNAKKKKKKNETEPV